MVNQQAPPCAAQPWDAGWLDLQQRLQIGQLTWANDKEQASAAMQAGGIEGSGSGGRYIKDDFERWQRHAAANQQAGGSLHLSVPAAAAA